MSKVAIDLVPIRPGKGGTGSGIWTYARELIVHLDQVTSDSDPSILVLVSAEQRQLLPPLRNLKLHTFPSFGRRVWSRLFWVHVVLPIWCGWRRIDVLHKLATETPWFCPAKRITTIHDFYHEFQAAQTGQGLGGTGIYFALMTRRALLASRCIVTVSHVIAQEVRARIPDASGTTVQAVHHGCVPSQAVVAKPKVSATTWTIGVVAKLMPYKGQLEALAAFEELNDDAARLVIHGFSNDTAFVRLLDARIAESPLKSHIQRRDYIRDLSLDALYGDLDVLLFLSQYEGFGLPVIEAQSRGIPVVCSDIPVLREVAGAGACFVERDNPQLIAAELRRIRADADFRAALIQKGLENVRRYDWQTSARRVCTLYTDISQQPS